MKKICGLLVVLVMTIGLIACGVLNNSDAKTKAHVPDEPDVVGSIKMNQDENLTVVANRDEIEDRVEFARLLVKMCQENAFHTIKFSTDYGYATSLDMRVYLWKDEIEGHDPVMRVEFKPIEWNQDYDIVNNPEMFELYVDGELIENE